MQTTETPELQIDISQLYQMLGMLTAENAALKLARAQDQARINLLMTPDDMPPSDDGQAYGAGVDIREPGVVEPEN